MKYYLEDVREVFKRTESSENGLSQSEAERRLEKYGKNKLAQAKQKSLVRRFFEQLADPMIIILIVAAVISAVTTVYEGKVSGSPSFPTDTVIILAVVLINAMLGVLQESKAEKAIEALQEMSAATSKVIREGKIMTVKSEDLTVGDIVVLEAGDAVPADCRIFESASLKIEEAALTGESVPVSKIISVLGAGDGGDIPLGDRKNMAYMGSAVVYGRGKAVVTDTGMNTEMGKIADAITKAEDGQTPLQKKLAGLSKTLTFLVLGICVFIFAFSLFMERSTLAGGDPALIFKSVIDVFMVAVSLAVAAVPEGLAAVVTIVLSIGVTNMSKKNAVIRKLTAVETLGCAQIICSDKTGTLTQNKMTVVDHYGDEKLLARAMSLCSDAQEDSDGLVIGEPTEAALVSYAISLGLHKGELKSDSPRIGEAPFDSGRKMMSTVHKTPDGIIQYTKGAPDVVVDLCTHAFIDGKIVPMTDEIKATIASENKRMADKALRVLAAAMRKYDSAPDDFSPEALEHDLIFIGLTGMIDPVRPEVKAAIEECRGAGITPVMITGDHAGTACATAKKLGILSRSGECLTGAQIDKMGENEFARAVRSCRVYARVTPEHKVRIVKALRAHGEVVAMTGDGVNDAPALKAADIGCAMGKGGTQVAQNAADMILTDDNFATIVKAVAQGRGIYDNIRRAIHYLLGCNIGEILCVFAATLFGMPAPLLPIQLLWINLVTDPLPALALGAERLDSRIMQRPPRDSSKSFFADRTGLDIALEGMLIGALSLFAFVAGNSLFKNSCVELGRTMAFATQSLCEIAHSFNMRSRRSVFSIGIFSNRKLTICAALCAALQLIVMTVPPLRVLFDVSVLNIYEWLTVAALALAPIAFSELGKAVGGKREE